MNAPVSLHPRLPVEAAASRGRAERRFRLTWGFLGTALVILAALPLVAPFAWMFATSLKSGAHAFDLPPAWLPTQWHWQNYLSLFQSNVPFATFIWNSLKISAAITAAQLLTCSMAGYAFAHLRFRGAKGLFPLLLTSLMMPVQVTIIPTFLLMSALNLVDTHWAAILPLGMFALGNVYGSGKVSVIMAAVALAICPVLILFLMAQRQIISGMVGSAIKG
jgi:multiple sugar transport system permease protein